jgi:hypothetical protein
VIEVGRQELADEVSVCGVKLDPIESGLLGATGAGSERSDGRLDVRGGHCYRLVALLVGHGGRCERGGPGQLDERFAARVCELTDDRPPGLVDGTVHRRQRVEHVIIVDAHLPRARLTFGSNVSV